MDKNKQQVYYFVNTGVSDDSARNWDYNLKYKFISAGNNIRFINRIRTLNRGDKIFAYIAKEKGYSFGYVGYGVVEEKAVLVKDYTIDGTKMLDTLDNHKWKEDKDENIDEWVVKINWIKTFERKNAKWKKNLKTSINNVCVLRDKKTVEYLEKEFDILKIPNSKNKNDDNVKNIQQKRNVKAISGKLTKKISETKLQTIQNDKYEIINKAFKLILPVLPEFIKNTLKEYDKNEWWEKFVIRKLPDMITRDLPKTGITDEGIYKLDISACLKIIIQNWHDIFKHKMNNIKLSWVHELLEIRNEDSHWTIEKLKKYSYEDIDRALDTMERFMRPIKNETADQIAIIKKDFESKYEKT